MKGGDLEKWPTFEKQMPGLETKIYSQNNNSKTERGII
jgi:hypothetical protein